jgi:hypothetical protein
MGVPFRNLPRLHDELVRSGWLAPDVEYPSYRAFWKACSAGGPVDAGGARPSPRRDEDAALAATKGA